MEFWPRPNIWVSIWIQAPVLILKALYCEKQDQEMWKVLNEIEPRTLNGALEDILPKVEDITYHAR